MLFNKKIIFRYQNFKNKYIKNKSQIGKGNYDANNTNEDELLEEFDVLENESLHYKFSLNNQANSSYILKLLSNLENGNIPYTQFPPRMVFCEDAIHDLGAIGANLLQNLPIIDSKIKEKGDDQSLDAIIKIEKKK